MLRRILSRLRGTSIFRRLIVGMTLVVIATVIVGGLPAVGVMWFQLEQQIWLRVQDTQSATQGLYNAEITRLKKLAGLIAINDLDAVVPSENVIV